MPPTSTSYEVLFSRMSVAHSSQGDIEWLPILAHATNALNCFVMIVPSSLSDAGDLISHERLLLTSQGAGLDRDAIPASNPVALSTTHLLAHRLAQGLGGRTRELPAANWRLPILQLI